MAPDQSLALMGVIEDAEAAEIPAAVVGSRVNLSPGPRFSNVLNNDAKDGYVAAKCFGHLLQNRGAIGIMGIDSALNGNIKRKRRFKDAPRKELSGIRGARPFGAYNIPPTRK